jgi:transposase
VVVARVPWARHGARFTRDFEDQAAWCATQQSKAAVTRLLRVGWRSVGSIVARVAADMRGRIGDPLDGLRRIGVDEISYRRGQRYVIGVVCHDTGRLVWAADGRSAEALGRFFAELGPRRCAKIALVSADAGAWVHAAVRRHCPRAMICMDAFHVVRLGSDALDEVRRDVWNAARRAGEVDTARFLKGARFALWKAPEKLSERQKTKLARVEEMNLPLYRAYLIKEQLRLVFREPDPDTAIALLDEWIVSAEGSGLSPFIQKAATIRELRAPIVAALRQRLSNARMEQLNTSIRLITRRAYGFRSAEALIALAMLALGGLCPPLPGRRYV